MTEPQDSHQSPIRRPRVPSRIAMLQHRKPLAGLTIRLKAALTILNAGDAVHDGPIWTATGGSSLSFQTIKALFARGLIIIVYPQRTTKRPYDRVTEKTKARHVARLTETGRLIAKALTSE